MDSNWSISKISDLSSVAWINLLKESEEEGFRFLRRLQSEYDSGLNRFDKFGEALYVVQNSNNEVVALGGINSTPNDQAIAKGRLRRFYVSQSFRRKGVGQYLLEHILAEAKYFFVEIELFTDTDAASLFYCANGFELIHNLREVTHRLPLK